MARLNFHCIVLLYFYSIHSTSIYQVPVICQIRFWEYSDSQDKPDSCSFIVMWKMGRQLLQIVMIDKYYEEEFYKRIK